MSKATTTSIVKVLNSRIQQALTKSESKTISKKLLFKAGSNLPTTQLGKLSY